MRICEISSVGSNSVDRDAGVIRGVKVLGRASKNGREYSSAAMAQAAKMYEGREVNVNHPDKSKAGQERKIEDGFGWLESVEVKADGVYADLHYLKEHPVAGLVTEAAERNPHRFGLSHNAEGSVARKDGKNVVESVERVLSVDLVQNPATNAGLFESVNETLREVVGRHFPTLLEDDALLPDDGSKADEQQLPPDDGNNESAAAKAALVQLLTAVVELPGDITDICVQLISVCQKIIAGQPEPDQQDDFGDEQEIDAENADEGTADDEQDQPADEESEDKAPPWMKRKKEMAEQTKTDPAVAKLREQLEKLQAELHARDTRDACASLLESCNRAVDEIRLGALARMEKDEDRKALVESWPEKDAPEPTVNRMRPAFSAPLRESADSIKYPTDFNSFVAALR